MIKLTGNYVVQVDVHNYILMRDRGKPNKDGGTVSVCAEMAVIQLDSDWGKI